jgi:hypothetical protein
MKRPPQRRSSVRSSDPFHDLSVEQLSYIGAIALLYNDVEAIVDRLCGLALGVTIRREELTSRINGVDGKIALIKLGVRQCFNESEMSLMEEALGNGGFKLLKSWRDAVVHSQVIDAHTSTGKVNERRGGASEVLLSLDALKGLFGRLDLLRVELNGLCTILVHRITLSRDELNEVSFELDDQEKERLELGIQAYRLQVQEHRNQRQALPPIPEFPEDISPAELVQRLREALAVSLPPNAGLSL